MPLRRDSLAGCDSCPDLEALPRRVLARDEEHYGMLFTDDATLPRSRAAVSDWGRALEASLIEHPPDDGLRNRVRGLV